MTDDLERAHHEAAELLGLDPSKLSAGDRLRCELVSALRPVVDDELAKSTSSRSADLARLIVAVEGLAKLLPREVATEPAVPSIYKRDPREVLEEMVERWIAAEEAERAERGLSGLMPDLPSAQARIDALEAELAALRNALPAPDGAERSRTPDDLKAMRPKPTMHGEAGPQAGPNDTWA